MYVSWWGGGGSVFSQGVCDIDIFIMDFCAVCLLDECGKFIVGWDILFWYVFKLSL